MEKIAPLWLEELISNGTVKNPVLIEAFKNVDREDFLPEEIKQMACADAALPLFKGQTISQPTTVAFMLELLEPERGQKILDIGSGSGWQTALLAHAVGERGKVFAIEVIPELKKYGEENVKKYGFTNVKFILADGKRGLHKEAPFDRVIAACYAPSVPQDLLKQLSPKEGRLVMPVGESYMQNIALIIKNNSKLKEKYFPGFVFVPLV